MTDTPDFDPLLPQIETALELYGVSQTAFGYYACGDPALIGKMKKGMLLRTRRSGRVARALERVLKNEGIPT